MFSSVFSLSLKEAQNLDTHLVMGSPFWSCPREKGWSVEADPTWLWLHKEALLSSLRRGKSPVLLLTSQP